MLREAFQVKRTVISAVFSLILTSVGLIVNLIWYRLNGRLLLGIRMYGGEIVIQSGFGLMFRHIYSMRPDGADSIRLSFDLLNFIMTFIAIFAIIFVLLTAVSLIFQNRKA